MEVLVVNPHLSGKKQQFPPEMDVYTYVSAGNDQDAVESAAFKNN